MRQTRLKNSEARSDLGSGPKWLGQAVQFAAREGSTLQVIAVVGAIVSVGGWVIGMLSFGGMLGTLSGAGALWAIGRFLGRAT